MTTPARFGNSTAGLLRPWTGLAVSSARELPVEGESGEPPLFLVSLLPSDSRLTSSGDEGAEIQEIDVCYRSGSLVSVLALGRRGGDEALGTFRWDRTSDIVSGCSRALAEAVIAGLPTAIAVTRDARVGATYLRFADLPVTRTERVNTSVNADYSGHTIVGIELI